MIRSEVTMKRNNLILSASFAFLCDIALAEFMSIAGKIRVEEWLLIKKYGFISCYINGLTATDQSLPLDNNNGNRCPHQSVASCFLSGHEGKRNKIPKC